MFDDGKLSSLEVLASPRKVVEKHKAGFAEIATLTKQYYDGGSKDEFLLVRIGQRSSELLNHAHTKAELSAMTLMLFELEKPYLIAQITNAVDEHEQLVEVKK